MARYVARRLLQLVALVVGATTVLFVCLFVIPGDPLATLAGGGRSRDPVVAETLRHRYALDRPLVVQYTTYVSGLLRGDLGRSFRLGRPVRAALGEKLGRTLQLAAAAAAIELFLGIAWGVASAVLRSTAWDVASAVVTALAVAVPTLVLGLVLQQVFASHLGWFPRSGVHGSVLRSVLLPAVTLAAADTVIVARLMRGSMLGVLDADYIRAARANGLPTRTIVLRHALPNAVVPVITYLGIAFGALMGGALVTEVIFNWDGIGNALVTAVRADDNPMVLGIATFSIAAFVVVNLVVDLVSGLLDPRIRLA